VTLLAERLKKARKDAGYRSASAAAEALGISYPTYATHENGTRTPKARDLYLYAKRFKVAQSWLLDGKDGSTASDHPVTPVQQIRVEGVSQAGMFRDISLIEDDEHERKTIPAPVNPKYAHAHQYALLVAGDSMNNKFQDGSYVTCAEWAGLGKELKHGMILHVERVKAGSMIETTIKTYIERDGKRWLEPDSTNSKHLPIEVNGSLDTEIHIKGAVIGSYTEFDI
jgi:SOS-response transcriptional repressor LexA